MTLTSQKECVKEIRSFLFFILAMEGLNVGMKTMRDKVIFEGIQPPIMDRWSHISSMRMIFIGEWPKRNIRNLAQILQCFHASSGLKVRFHRSKVFVIRVTS